MKWQQRPTPAAVRKPQAPRRKPRNPHVAASRFRKAGAHGRSQGGARAEAMRDLRNQLRDLPPRGP